MKNRSLLIFIGVIIYLFIIFCGVYYLIIPGVNKVYESSKVKIYTYDEKNKALDEINDKYKDEVEKINEKYTLKIEEINEKYIPSVGEINEKYDKLKDEIESKYKEKTKELNDEINDKRVMQNKEFFANGLSKKYYTLNDEINELSSEQSKLNSEKSKENNNNESLRNTELFALQKNKNDELNVLDDDKKSEMLRLDEKKDNEISDIYNSEIKKDEIKKCGILKIILGIILVIIPVLYVITIFNKLTKALNNIKEKWSSIDILLKERNDLIPNVVNSIKGLTKHEKDTLTSVTKLRNLAINANTKDEEIKANMKLDSAISKILLLEENYPELKSNANFISLESDLKKLEDRISISRTEYNNSVLKYKNKLETFPSNIVSAIFRFKPELFFEIDDSEKENVNIDFE